MIMSRVWVRAGAAPATAATLALEASVFGRSMFDSLLLRSVVTDTNESSLVKHYDRQMVSLWQEVVSNAGLTKDSAASTPNPEETCESNIQNDHYHVVLEPLDACKASQSSKDNRYDIPMGRARSFPLWGATACPTTVKPVVTNSKKPHPALAVVGLILDSTGRHILLTRRPGYMRSFPGAWVLPGGGLDDNDRTLEDALRREIQEETGLILQKHSVQPMCLWESVYPTDPIHPGPIRAHHLVVFMQGFVDRTTRTMLKTQSSFHLPSLTLQASEVESAMWLSVEDFRKVRQRMEAPNSDTCSLPTVLVTNSDGTTEEVSLDTLVGIYPQPQRPQNSDNPQRQQQWCGIAQGSLFALEELLLKSDHKDHHPHYLEAALWSRSLEGCA
jgi:8-oxo-dGTP pyrophosphatase MutT (NUDIX family)